MKPLSPNNNQLHITIPLILAGFAFILAIILMKNNWLHLFIGVSTIGGISFFYILRIYNRIENVCYDNDFIYLESKYQTRKVKLQQVKRVKLTLSNQRVLGVQFHKYQIEFVNEFGVNDSVNIWLNSIYDRISEFEKYLEYYAPNAKIVHSASTFDT